MLTSVLTDVSAATATCTLRLHLSSESNFALTCTYDQSTGIIEVPSEIKCDRIRENRQFSQVRSQVLCIGVPSIKTAKIR